GDIFGAPLAIEATVAFFLESSFIGLWMFGWNKVSKKMHALSIWIVAFATNLSALWILLANGWMQKPVGYVLRNNRAEMVDFMALLTNPYGWTKFFHTILSGYVLAAFFVMGVSAYHLLRKNNIQFFNTSFKIASRFALISALFVLMTGDFHGVEIAKTQPTKFAAMESVWETQKAAAYPIIAVPDPKNERNSFEAILVPKMLSYLAFHDKEAEVKGLKAFPREDRPPVTITFLSFRLMVGLGFLLILLSLLAVVLSRKGTIETKPTFLRIMLFALILPYIAVQIGWIVAEVGRQPWIVYGLMRTADAVSKSIDSSQVLISLAGFTLFYGFLAVIDVYLLTKYSKKGPEESVSRMKLSSVAEEG
ncbi:MAG: cytochrome ubiquinol oxidase subunit, partial [Nitrospirae bacterium]|nr:cytochrome ubiquinol oxidase subunit [Nitrospirota bacterium]